ncbi:hypothetical protein KI387_028735 [Taxus chinensis]|uniref:Uncharacterized protein n=1 Tax=Taxus chinensis TaxID=29808 RepID=A0AA38FC71_TAXCH|nr:hypothetical protein KI387_028735 [Taxus chinensis]
MKNKGERWENDRGSKWSPIETIEEEPLLENSGLPSGPENIIVLSESDEGEVPNPTRTLEFTVEEEKEVPSTEPLSTTDSSTQKAPDTSLTSLLEATVVNTLSAMGSLALGPLVTSPSSSTFAWVQPLVDSRKRKPSSHLTGPNFDVVTTLLGTTPPPPAKRAKTTSRIVIDAQGQQFLEVTKPKVDKAEHDLLASDLELSRIPMGESTPKSEVHNLQEIVTKVIERVEKGKKTIEQLEEQNQVLSNFIKSLLAKDKVLDPTPLATLPPHMILSQDEVHSIKDIHRYSTYGRAMEAMVDDMTITGLKFIQEAFKDNEKVANLQQKLSSSIGTMDKELKLWSSCIIDLRLMGQGDEKILMANKFFDDAKNNLSGLWVFSVEWKIKVLEEALGELRNR